MDPFRAALDALFSVPPAEDAVFTPRGAASLPEPIRVIVGRPDERVSFGEGAIINAEIVIAMRMHEVAEPTAGDRVATDTGAYDLIGEPVSDLEGMTWQIGAREVPLAV